MPSSTTELKPEDCPCPDLPMRILDGEVFMLKNGLHESGLFDLLEQATFAGIRSSMGDDVAERVKQVGVEKIHTVVAAADIPKLTDSVYDFITASSLDFLKPFVGNVLGITGSFFFERKPNVRFHIPHDVVANEIKNFKEFTRQHGDGKITPHKTHRDSWVDCPANLINVWIAVGPVREGNSLTLYPTVYRDDIKNNGPYIRADENPGPADTFEMDAGDVLLFHGNHLHGSEINSTDCTRHVISFRIVLEKPNYTHGHYHHYAHSALAGGALDWLAELPQNLAWSYVRQVGRSLGKLAGLQKSGVNGVAPHKASAIGDVSGDDISVPLASLQPGTLHAVSDKICVMRTDSGEVKAFSRYCPHQGADLSLGAIREHDVMCPWHNLPLDPDTGASPCQSLRKIKTYPCEIRGDQVHITRTTATVD